MLYSSYSVCMKSDAIILNQKCAHKLELLLTSSCVFSHKDYRKEDSLYSYVMAFLGYIFAIKSGIRKNNLNFEPLSKAVFGPWSMYNFFFTYYVNAVGLCTAYVILIGDSLTSLFEPMGPDFLLTRTRITMIIATCIILSKTCIC